MQLKRLRSQSGRLELAVSVIEGQIPPTIRYIWYQKADRHCTADAPTWELGWEKFVVQLSSLGSQVGKLYVGVLLQKGRSQLHHDTPGTRRSEG